MKIDSIKRLGFDVVGIAILFSLFMFNGYEVLPAPLQLVALKAILVSAGILHAHITRKLLFPKINWESDFSQGKLYAVIALYITIPICYSFGG